MTRSEAVAKCRNILDELVEEEIATRNYTADEEALVRHAMNKWKLAQIGYIERWVDAVAKRMLH
jgi:hypothetical protein